jgi:gliding motility-associated-like protein
VNVYGWPQSGFFSSPAIQNSVLNPRLLSPGLQYISFLGYNGVCLDSASLPLLVLDVPQIDFGIVPDSLCEGAAAFRLDQVSPLGGNWAGTGLEGNLFFPVRSGINRLLYTLPAIDSLRCSNSATLEFFVKAKPQTRLGADTSLCEGESIRLGNAGNNFQFSWNDGSRDNIRAISSTGSYHFTVRDGLCSWNSDTLLVSSMKPLPVFSLGPDRSDCFRDSVRLRVPVGMKAYSWEKDGIQVSTDSIFVLGEEAAIQLNVIAENGCSFTDRLLLVKRDCPEVYVPEAFSPNGDGVNEVWRIFGSGILNLNVKVFNLWGEVVFEGLGKDAFWDGNFRGQPCPAGTYQFILQYSGNSSEEKSFSDRLAGQLFLLR